MRAVFYDDPFYKQKQAEITKKYYALHPRAKILITRTCNNPSCKLPFQVKKSSNPKIYCSHSCAASVNNLGRRQSLETRKKIAASIKVLPPGHYQRIYRAKKPRIILTYVNPVYNCSNHCVMQVVGRMTTSPKAAKSKPGITHILRLKTLWENILLCATENSGKDIPKSG